jgi:hypothetical protein
MMAKHENTCTTVKITLSIGLRLTFLLVWAIARALLAHIRWAHPCGAPAAPP